MCEICHKNALKKKRKRKFKKIFKMEELNRIALGKGLFASIKGQCCLTRACEGQIPPSSEVVFNTFDSNLSFSEIAPFIGCLIPRHFILLK